MFKALKYLFLVLLIVGGGRLLFELTLDHGFNIISKGMTGHSMEYVAPYNVKNELHKLRMECNIRGTAWCDRNYKKAVASIYSEAKRQAANK